MSIAERVINVERQRFREYYKLCLEFLVQQNKSQRPTFLAGEHAARAFESKAFSLDELVQDAKSLRIFCDRPEDFSIALLKFIMQRLPNNAPYKFELLVYPVIPEVEFALQIPTRRLVIARDLGTYRGKTLSDLVRPPIISDIALISPEILLVSIYRQMFTLDSDERPAAARLEQRLFDRFLGEFHRGELIEGGHSSLSSPNIIALRRSIIEEFSGDSLVVGQQAINPDSELSFLQLCTEATSSDIRGKLQATFDSWSDAATHKPLIQQYDLSLPVDPYLQRFRLSVGVGDGPRIPIVDVFTAGQYDIYAAHPYLYLRFIIADVWTIMLLHNVGELDKRAADRQLARLITLAKATRGKIVDLDTLSSTDCRGSYVEDAVMARRKRGNGKYARSEITYGALIAEADVKK